MEKDGIEKERCCTDIFCLVLFWGFIGAMCYATLYGYNNGEVNKLTAPIDGGLNFCGFGDYKDYKKMMLTNFHPVEMLDILKSGVCIKACPTEKDKDLTNDVDCKDNEKIKCDARKTYETTDLFDFCMPTGEDTLNEDEKEGYGKLLE